MNVRPSLLCVSTLFLACSSNDPAQEPETEPDATSTGALGTNSTGLESTSESSGSTSDNISSGTTEADASSSTGDPSVPPPTEVWRAFAGAGNATALCLFDDDRIAVATSSATSTDSGGAAIRVLDPEGEEVWSTGFGEGGLSTYVHALDCAADGSIYAVGLQGETSKSFSPRALMLRLDATGEVTWLNIAPEVPSSTHYGVHADDSGFFAVGWDATPGPVVARYDTDGVEVWRRNDGFGGLIGSLRDVLLLDGVLYAVGDASNGGWLAAMSEDGQVLWTETFAWTSRVSADMLLPDPDGTVLVVGYLEQTGFRNPDFAWALPCDEEACGSEPFEAAEVDRLYGFAIGADGNWIVNGRDKLVGRVPGGGEAWSLQNDFDWTYVPPRRDLLGVDSTGAILVAGGNPAGLRKLIPAEK